MNERTLEEAMSTVIIERDEAWDELQANPDMKPVIEDYVPDDLQERYERLMKSDSGI
jgi:hypothetical protein